MSTVLRSVAFLMLIGATVRAADDPAPAGTGEPTVATPSGEGQPAFGAEQSAEPAFREIRFKWRPPDGPRDRARRAPSANRRSREGNRREVPESSSVAASPCR